jgi:hypothetical protein
MQQLEVRRNELHIVMSETQAVSELADKGKQLKQIDEKLPALEARWLELTDLLENTSTQSYSVHLLNTGNRRLNGRLKCSAKT